MLKRKTCRRVPMFALFMLPMILVVFLFGTVALGAAEKKDDNKVLQLSAEVAILRAVDKLDLTKDQLGKLIPILKELDAAREKAVSELEASLLKEKELLLKDELSKEKAEELKFQRSIVMKEFRLVALKARTEATKLLTVEQAKKIRSFVQKRMAERWMRIGMLMRRRMVSMNRMGMNRFDRDLPDLPELPGLEDQGARREMDPEVRERFMQRIREWMAKRNAEVSGEGGGEQDKPEIRESTNLSIRRRADRDGRMEVLRRFSQFRGRKARRGLFAAGMMRGRGLDLLIKVLEEKYAAM